MELTFEQEEHLLTGKIFLAGFVIGLLSNLWYFALVFDWAWWNDPFPINLLSRSFAFTRTMLHELGHAVLFIFYGYYAIPAYGVTLPLTGQMTAFPMAWCIILLYLALRHWRDKTGQHHLYIGLCLFNLATAYWVAHSVVIGFAGHIFEVAFLTLFMAYALFDVVGGVARRTIFAALAMSFFIRFVTETMALLFNTTYQEEYRFGEMTGDLERIAQLTGLPFAFGVCLWLFLSCLAVAGPVYRYVYPVRKTVVPDIERQENLL